MYGFGRVVAEEGNMALEQSPYDRRDHQQQGGKHVARVEVDLVAIFETAIEQQRETDIGQGVEEPELGDLPAFGTGQVTGQGRGLDMDDPHSRNQEEGEQQEDRQP